MKRHKRHGGIATAASVLVGAILLERAFAEPLTLDEYRHPKTNTDMVSNKAYLMGARDALVAANTLADQKLFCMPGDVGLSSFDQVDAAMTSWARKNAPGPSGYSVASALLHAIQQRFPCGR